MKLKPWQLILGALIAAVAIGWIINTTCATSREPELVLNGFGEKFVGFFAYLGELFLRALKMIIVPLIFSSIVVAIAGLGKTGGFGRLGVKTLGYYVLTSFFAIISGLALVNWIQPGYVDGKPNPEIVEKITRDSETYEDKVAAKTEGQKVQGLGAVGDIFKRMIPENIFDAFGNNGRMLSLIFVSLLVAFALMVVSQSARTAVLGFLEGVNEITLVVTNWIMFLAPIGVFGLVLKTVAYTGIETFGLLGKYFLVVLGSLLIHLLVVLPLILKFIGKVNPWRQFYAMRNALLTAFSTASSSATLPVTMRALRENAGVSNRVSSFVLPLGATVNMDGTALYECVAVIFAVQLLGYDLPMSQQFLVVALALLTSIGVAGIPSASLVAITIILNNVTIDGEYLAGTGAIIGFLLAVDRPLDMSRTAVNVFSDSCGAVVIAKSEGESVLENKTEM
ncbi:MAG: dicarboxylate/amino acid:cation symporter [Verrucomicrobiota bacterium]